jgi:hypothetical protein
MVQAIPEQCCGGWRLIRSAPAFMRSTARSRRQRRRTFVAVSLLCMPLSDRLALPLCSAGRSVLAVLRRRRVGQRHRAPRLLKTPFSAESTQPRTPLVDVAQAEIIFSANCDRNQ